MGNSKSTNSNSGTPPTLPNVSNNEADEVNYSPKNLKSNYDTQQISNQNQQQPDLNNFIVEGFLTKFINENDKDLPLLSVIVTIFSGSSYDDLFRQVPPVAAGGRISLYSLELDKVSKFFEEFQNPNVSQNNVIKTLAKEISELAPDSILFNFECCSGCENVEYHFPDTKSTMELIKYLLDKGNMVMCSDFAVKSLINDWDQILGPNPFVQVGQCSDFLELFFDPKVLQESPSKQLQMVGQLCETGTTNIHALSDTVVVGINKNNADNKFYTLSILTIITKTGEFKIDKQKDNSWSIGEKTGTIGHALLKFKSGGLLLISAGHWIELANLNVNINNLETAAKTNYGENNEYMEEINQIKCVSDKKEKEFRMNKMANRFVQQTAACNYSSFSKK